MVSERIDLRYRVLGLSEDAIEERAMPCVADAHPLKSRSAAWGTAAFVLAAIVLGPTAPAQGQQGQALGGVIHNVRGGVLAHDRGLFSSNEEDGANINIEIQFTESSWDAWRYILSPRPIVGGNINTAGDTSRGYAGLYWDYYPVDWAFVGAAVGATVHDGETSDAPGDRRALGSRVLFHLALEVGVRFADHHGLSIYADHASNAGLADENEGIESVGIRYTYFFGGR